ncbi:5-deoxy-glucuronate isomerase [Thermobispora bispora]|uniref:Myo-inositol catabolism IolB domain protein n=1 Tax=Thermobispora bispora (strain ATCC 19993 / DSM 43833 / CBS 139.67 / JCM 10125 / KCTC 9307 / NBRC 14880 / R51) TaxID=469371 RepID=D6Y7R0_THEBD|nr:5-deoxy-glucuronate isomerase [Thermobispora bispora]MBO2473901.1 5-deoxy-glucuronate isomerase [Actinomycetales bacterium]MDI9580568.1 5-deoxy-glucuronate isomerase [Thermobispora sp.]ADG89771.1 Myo-inositol catabolism IolB domain protein [Thermobispora bispora DSM 43833]MBX6166906.1 5-deoxy-glucuronate isomerase [Thermobispora bispora]QSI49361.1 5-deoxy-glucuronate isomerase [Thermobispora bispora]
MTYIPFGTASEGPWSVLITPERAGWTYCGLRIADLTGEPIEFETGDEEMLVVPLAGSCEVVADGERIELAGRSSVFASVTDFAYLPIQASVRITGQGRIALPSAKATRRLPVRYGPAADVPVEIRGAGHATRQVNNFCAPEAFECDKLMAVEVLTPGGNWSSYPPHKHDTPGGQEAVLEEIYYFEGGPGYQRVYGSHEVLAEVSAGDVVLVPRGYHGPSMAAPGYDLYYLNVLAGPGEKRSMAFCDDPRHAWIRSTWADQPIDPRVPFGK